MELQYYIFAGIVCAMLFVTGILLLLVWHCLKTSQQAEMRRFLSGNLVHTVKQAMLEGVSEAMDEMPEKIMEVKRTIDEGGMQE